MIKNDDVFDCVNYQIMTMIWVVFYVCGCSLAVTSTGLGGFMFFVALCRGTPEA